MADESRAAEEPAARPRPRGAVSFPADMPGGAVADRDLRIPTSHAAARKADSDPPA